MKLTASVLFIFAIFISTNIFAQTAKDLEKAYGTQTIYEIRPKILMRAKFGNSGEVCKVTLQPNTYSEKTNTTFFGESGLDVTQLKEALHAIIPRSQRSGQIKPPPAGYDISGSFFGGTLRSDDIHIGVAGTWRDDGGETVDFCDILGTDKSKLNKFSFCTMHGVLGLLTIEWPKRGCE